MADELTSDATRYGLDSWADVGAAQTATVAALAALNEEPADPAALQAHIAVLTAIVDDWRAREIKSMITTYDGVLARLLIGAGQLTSARDRVRFGVGAGASRPRMHYYDAEHCVSVRIPTPMPIQSTSDLRAAIELARTTGCAYFRVARCC